MTKTIDYADIIFDRVNLEGYSSSPGWVGYCDQEKYCRRSLRPLLDGLQQMLDDRSPWVVASSLFQQIYDQSQTVHDGFFEPSATQRKRLNHIIADKTFGDFVQIYAPGEQKNAYDIEALRLRIIAGKTWDEIKRFLFLWFDFHRTIPGHIFLLNLNQKIIIYPHWDNFGFGFIALDEASRKKWQHRLRRNHIANGFAFKGLPEWHDESYYLSLPDPARPDATCKPKTFTTPEINLIRQNVDLYCPGNSPGWIGRYGTSRRGILPMLDALSQSIIGDVKHWVAVSSLHYELPPDNNAQGHRPRHPDAAKLRRQNLVTGQGLKPFLRVHSPALRQKHDLKSVIASTLRFRVIRNRELAEIRNFLFLWIDCKIDFPGYFFLLNVRDKIIVAADKNLLGFDLIALDQSEQKKWRSKLQNTELAARFTLDA